MTERQQWRRLLGAIHLAATVTVPEERTTAGTNAPLSTPRKAFDVHSFKSLFRLCPPSTFGPSVIIAIASKNRASPPAAFSAISMTAALQDYWLESIYELTLLAISLVMSLIMAIWTKTFAVEAKRSKSLAIRLLP